MVKKSLKIVGELKREAPSGGSEIFQFISKNVIVRLITDRPEGGRLHSATPDEIVLLMTNGRKKVIRMAAIATVELAPVRTPPAVDR